LQRDAQLAGALPQLPLNGALQRTLAVVPAARHVGAGAHQHTNGRALIALEHTREPVDVDRVDQRATLEPTRISGVMCCCEAALTSQPAPSSS
jgi:hypothetical protein